MYVCVYLCVYVCHVSSLGGQKNVLELLQMEFKGVVNCLVWVPGTQLGVPARAIQVLYC